MCRWCTQVRRNPKLQRNIRSIHHDLFITGEVSMSQSTRPVLSEKGLLTPDNCVVTMIDLQPQMLFGVAGSDRNSIINHNVALAKAARVFGVPVVLSTVESKAFSGNLWPQVQAVFPG